MHPALPSLLPVDRGAGLPDVAPILAGLLPTRGALVGIAALVALAVLDRIPLHAYRPRASRDRMSRRRPPRPAPAVTLTRLDQLPAPPRGPAIPPPPRGAPSQDIDPNALEGR